MHAPTDTEIPERCQFEHKLFSSLGEVAFRRSSSDGVAMMAVHLGDREAFIPLKSLQREFAIGEDSPDARMLELVGNSLDFVTSLQPGDKLPLEIRTGEASWRPSAAHRDLAGTRLRRQFVAAHTPDGLDVGPSPAAGESALSPEDELALHRDVLAAAQQAAPISAWCGQRTSWP